MNVWRQGGDSISITTGVEAAVALPTLDGTEKPSFVAVSHDGPAGCWIRFGGSAVVAENVGFLLIGGEGVPPQRFAVGGASHIATKAVSGTPLMGVTPLAESRQ